MHNINVHPAKRRQEYSQLNPVFIGGGSHSNYDASMSEEILQHLPNYLPLESTYGKKRQEEMERSRSRSA